MKPPSRGSTTHRIRLDEAVAAAAGVTRSHARALIMAGRVRVAGIPATKAGANVRRDVALDIVRARPFVSRGGEKLDGALRALALEVAGHRCLDVGASTGGFTDALLAHGARHVTAIDVGYGQLADTLRNDRRVRVVERTNFRTVGSGALGEPFDTITIDASFISVVTLAARAGAFLCEDGAVLALVKPQFEAGPKRLGRGGVVRDPRVHRAVLCEVRAALLEADLVPVRLVASSLIGASGNVEFFTLLRRAGTPYDDAAIESAVATAPQSRALLPTSGADVDVPAQELCAVGDG